MSDRTFPLLYAEHVSETAGFYEKLGFAPFRRSPETGDPEYIALRRGQAEMAVVSTAWPPQQYGGTASRGPSFEMFVQVDDLTRTLEKLRADGISVLRSAVDMPWGERIAYVSDPEGNPVALATSTD
ncbi:bleomycin resistance protein [Streptomyces triticagri]|uniref:Bleomycin resistance protein n=1 Tax=Streptomyces triticagri TaxID=2293568 RepID=A0A372M7F6_9ACTN|nr:VOC family protein [Streptomyces triticagri]RFU86789.1 bleomycin resistance protein [Streptomyces triticagri]